MTWLEVALIVVLLAGLGAGAVLVVQRPSFWIGMGTAVFTAVLPALTDYLTRRNTPAVEKAMRDCYRRGGKWNNFTKRCE